MKQPLKGTRWLCTDDSLEAFGQYGTITDGFIDPEYNGDNEVEIKYEDGTTGIMKYRRFTLRHQRVIHTVEPKKKKAAKLRYYELIPEFENLMRKDTSSLSAEDIQRREELWKEIKYRKDL